jgi:hypothetical protein
LPENGLRSLTEPAQIKPGITKQGTNSQPWDAISYSANHSIMWAIIDGLLSRVYVIYYAIVAQLIVLARPAAQQGRQPVRRSNLLACTLFNAIS